MAAQLDPFADSQLLGARGQLRDIRIVLGPVGLPANDHDIGLRDTRRDLDYALDVGLRMLMLRHLVDEYDGLYSARLEELPVLRYYANSIAHLLPA